MSLLIQKSGFLTTVQDLGRFGFRRFGINPGGAMDKTAVRLINVLLDNDENSAVLEMHFPAPEFVFETETVFALGGANFNAELNGHKIENWRPVMALRGNRLAFANRSSGQRAYLAVKNGFQTDKWLNSQSTNLQIKGGGFAGRALQTNDRILFEQNPEINNFCPNFRLSHKIIPRYSAFPTVRVIAGAEFECLSKAMQNLFTAQNYAISNNSDRMGFRLQGTPLKLSKPLELLSSAVNYGTIQLLPDGQLIVLMADHQTTGGYPRLANIIPTDLPLVAQLGAGDKLAFQTVSVEEAENLNCQFENDLNFLRAACKFRF